MVSLSVIIAMVTTLFISFFLPIIVYMVYVVKNKGKGVWLAWLLGMAGFFVPQILIRLPILNFLSRSQGFLSFAANHYVLYYMAMAFTAGLFEAAGRYAVAKIMKKNLTFVRGVAAGLGHGGIEAMILIGMTYMNNLIYVWLINSGSFDAIVEQTKIMGAEADSLLAVKEVLVGSGPLLYYLAGYERLLTMTIHVALSLLVCYFVYKGKDLQGILICIALHFMADFVPPLFNGLAAPYLGSIISQNMAYVFVYLYLTAAAAGAIVFIVKLKKRWKE